MKDISVVILVIKDEVENLSMFSKEKFCNLTYKSLRKFFAKPFDALAAKCPPKIPHVIATIDNPTKSKT
jgi:hypothetical protein